MKCLIIIDQILLLLNDRAVMLVSLNVQSAFLTAFLPACLNLINVVALVQSY